MNMSAVKRRVRFPRFKTREKRVGTQEVVHRTLIRGSEKAQPLEITSINESASQGEPADHCTSELPVQQYSNTDNDSPTAVSGLPSLHKIKQKASIAAWEAIRPAILNTVTESFAMPKDQLCTYCDVMPASFRCLQCGPSVYYCSSCLHDWHKNNNVFHTAEEWKVYMAVIYDSSCIHCAS